MGLFYGMRTERVYPYEEYSLGKTLGTRLFTRRNGMSTVCRHTPFGSSKTGTVTVYMNRQNKRSQSIAKSNGFNISKNQYDGNL